MVALTYQDIVIDGRDGRRLATNVAAGKGGAGRGPAAARMAPAFCGGASVKCRNVARCDWPRQRRSLLTRTIEQEIVPRLVLARKAAPERPLPPPPGTVPVCAEEASELARKVVARDPSAASAFVEAVLARGTTLETLHLDLLAPAARRLGEWWSDDLCDFAQVTMGLWRLQQLLRETGSELPDPLVRRENDRRVLLVPVPGEQHTFGLAMVATFLSRAGWTVWSEPLASSNDLVGIVRSEWFAVVGFSLSCPNRLEALATNIRRVRRASRNPAVGILVGGQIFVERPELVVLVGADATAVDGRQATLQAENLIALRAITD
jgi:methanogenic corrinoid protein MtbC1